MGQYILPKTTTWLKEQSKSFKKFPGPLPKEKKNV
jgi:hypothetical protein